jgi:O-antigen ligase
MLITYNLSAQGKHEMIVRFLFISSLILAVYQLLLPETSENSFADFNGEERISVLGTDPNFTASYIGLSLLFGLLALLKLIPATKWYKFLGILSIPISFFAILRTGSRGGLLAIIMGIVAIIFIYKGFKKKIGALLFLSVILTIGALFILRNELFFNRIQNFLFTGETAGRTELWEQSIQLSSDSPLFGYGNRMYLRDLGIVTGFTLRGTHNIFLSVLLATGWIGSVFFMIFYISVLRTAWKFRNVQYGGFLFTAFILCFFSALTINLEIAKWFWILLTLCLSQKEVYLNTADEQEQMKMPWILRLSNLFRPNET